MKRHLAVLLNGAALTLVASGLHAQTSGSRRPNFVVILGEGAGWNSTSVPMDDTVPGSKSDLLQTPNLARLATEGMRFANFYAASARCTPSRAAIFTGRSPASLHMTFINDGRQRGGGGPDPGLKVIEPGALMELPAGEVTIGDLLKRAGYATAHFGKWHVGRASLGQHGFDENDGPTGNDGPDGNQNPNPEQAFAMTERGVAFMAKQATAGKPFYLQMSHYPGRRGEADVRPETYTAVRQRAGSSDGRRVASAAILEDMDATIGTVLKKLDELGIANNTYVLYTTDHGAQGRGANRPLAGGKGTLSEGGIRVPLIVRGPGIKAGTFSHVPATDVDLLPTIAAIAHVTEPLPRNLEGGSLVSLLAGAGRGVVKRSREGLYFHFPHYDEGNDGPVSALILGNDKLIKNYATGDLHLYDLAKDLSEERDLAKESPQKAADLDRRLTTYLKEVGAQLPVANPNFDPSKAPANGPGMRPGGRRPRPGDEAK
jgi:arylsulfatase A-like enzyme